MNRELREDALLALEYYSDNRNICDEAGAELKLDCRQRKQKIAILLQLACAYDPRVVVVLSDLQCHDDWDDVFGSLFKKKLILRALSDDQRQSASAYFDVEVWDDILMIQALLACGKTANASKRWEAIEKLKHVPDAETDDKAGVGIFRSILKLILHNLRCDFVANMW